MYSLTSRTVNFSFPVAQRGSLKVGTHGFEIENIAIGNSNHVKLILYSRIFTDRNPLIWNVEGFNFTLPNFNDVKSRSQGKKLWPRTGNIW